MHTPADKYLLQDYRDDLRVVDAPQWIDTDVHIVPVKAIGTGIPKPSARQRLITYMYNVNTTLTDTTISSVSSTKSVYLLGVTVLQAAATVANIYIFDATSGAAPSQPAVNTGANNTYVLMVSAPATAGTFVQEWLPYPLKVINGLRLDAGGAGQSALVMVYYIEEVV